MKYGLDAQFDFFLGSPECHPTVSWARSRFTIIADPSTASPTTSANSTISLLADVR